MEPARRFFDLPLRPGGAETRQRALRAIRINYFVMVVVSLLFLVCGTVFLSGAAVLRWDASMYLLGGIFAVLGALGLAYMAMSSRPVSLGLLRSGLVAEADVVEVVSVGRLLSLMNPGTDAHGHSNQGAYAMYAKLTLDLAVRGAGGPSRTRLSELVIVTDFPRVKAGATIPVRVDARDPSRVAIDWDRVV